MTNPDARHAKKRVKEKTSFFFVDPRHQMEELRSGYAIYPNLLLFLVLIFCPPFQTSLSCVYKGDHPRSKREKRETKYEMTYPPPQPFLLNSWKRELLRRFKENLEQSKC